MGQRRGVPESGVSAAADAAAGASWHAELPQPGRDAVLGQEGEPVGGRAGKLSRGPADGPEAATGRGAGQVLHERELGEILRQGDRKSTRLNSSHLGISYAVFCLKKQQQTTLRAGTSTGGPPPAIPHARDGRA